MISNNIEQLSLILKEKDIAYAFGVSGSGNSLDFITSLEEKGIRYFPVAHEAAAALMAGSCCRNGKVNAAAISIKGPGFINLVPGILSNYYECRPAITISEAYGDNNQSFQKHKKLDHYSVISSIVKGFVGNLSLEEEIRQLIDEASNEIPGPVHIEMCQNKKSTNKIYDLREGSLENQSDLNEVFRLIKSSKKPAVILGSLAARYLADLGWEKIGIPVTTTASAKGTIDEFCPFSAGVITGEIKEYSPEEAVLSKADLIIAFGLRNTEVIKPMNFSVPFVIIDTVSNDLHKSFQPTVVYVTKNINEIASSVKTVLEEKTWGDSIIADNSKAIEEELLSDFWLPAPAFRCLQETLDENVIMTLDTGIFCIIGETIWKARKPDDFCGSSIGRFMGTSIPTAIGIALSSTGKRVVCVAGDGGIRPYLPEIKLAVEEKLPVLFMLMSDCRYGTIAMSALNKKSSFRAFEIFSPEWWRAVEMMGCRAIAVSNLDEMKNALKDWIKMGGPMFMEMVFDKEKYINSVLKLR